MKNLTLRNQIDDLIAAGDGTAAFSLLGALWHDDPSPALAGFILSRFDSLKAQLQTVHCRIYVLRSFTIEPVISLLRAGAAVNNIDIAVQVGDFNAYPQEILNPNSSLYRYSPDIAILAVQTRDIAPELWSDFADLSREDVISALERVESTYKIWIETFRSHTKAHLIIHALETPAIPRNGILDTQSQFGQIQAIREINQRLHQLALKNTGVYILDYDSLIARHGKNAWHDQRKWLSVRLPIAADCLVHLANEWLCFIHPLMGKICKVLVTDLDNTLWGGVIGEDGLHGIQLDSEYPAAAFLSLQRVILDLYQRGVILAICSKNNWDDAIEVLEQHSKMMLQLNQFAALRINWENKATNLLEIAAELNIGLDSIAFLDDNPAERLWIKSQLPEVTVINLPQDPMKFAESLQASPVFQRLTISGEDLNRGKYYAEQRLRNELQHSITSIEDFYWSLQMHLEIETVSLDTVARVAQLTQKTNQFNLTTRRYSEQQIAEMVNNPKYRVISARLKDRFGDNGLIGVMIIRVKDKDWEIDTFLLSCRVIGRTVETAMLASVAKLARSEDVEHLEGWYIPTKKNLPVRNFYGSHGFQCIQDADSGSRWMLELSRHEISTPPWIKSNELTGEFIQ